MDKWSVYFNLNTILLISGEKVQPESDSHFCE